MVAALADDNVQSLGDWSRPLTSGLVNNGVVRAFEFLPPTPRRHEYSFSGHVPDLGA